MRFIRANSSSAAVVILLAGALMLALPSAPANADVIVIGSDTPDLKAGTILADSATLDVPAGASVTIMLSSGRTERIKGPLKRPVAGLGAGESVDKGIWDSVAKYVQKQGQPNESRFGAVRSIAPRATPAALGFSWRQVPIDADGDICVEKGARIEFARRASGKPVNFTIVDTQRQKRVEARFAQGSTTTPWPDGMALRVGTYALVVENAPMRQFRLRLVSPLPNADETLRVLHGQRCQKQAEAWLDGIMRGAN